ncbi:MAG TPA: ImmA/IrrE family metallo-endopeptidase [Bacteroidales bacterium]|nr:ImmA/IrrE family metallo-endopeptidase [Bacteroidales bacterium]
MKVKHNIKRIEYLLSLYKMTTGELLLQINMGLKKQIQANDLFGEEIEINHLKRIDKIFNKGLHYYLDENVPVRSDEASIFFRKERFISDLNLEARKVVNRFEELKISLEAISKLVDIRRERLLPIFSTRDDPEDVAHALSKQLYPAFEPNKRNFLKALIERFAEYNILVFEFIETWNKKVTANIDGFFLHPNVIVLKREQNAFSREIFTLIHELGHYLLNIEEVEQIDVLNMARRELSAVERWCNDFAFCFLAGERLKEIAGMGIVDDNNDYFFDRVSRLSGDTHLSKLAIYTRLLFNGQISQANYNLVRIGLEENFRLKKEEKARQKEIDKMLGVKSKGSAPKPINSPLLISTVQIAYYEGVLNESDVCKTLNISPEKLELFIQ